ncbi:MAG TPA: AMP-binding protein, partial [Candidatus Limnocylindria bacterium]|nr:AMP-binding protein [Candidatus Limnocylindria bacterium]
MAITARPDARFTYREVALHDRLREVRREVGTKIALLHGDRRITYAELDAATDRLAGALARRGIGPGDRVTIFMPNSIEFVLAFYATLKAGGVVN